MYDACAMQRNLYRMGQILHREISDRSIVLASASITDHDGNYRTTNCMIKFANQVLAKDKNVMPEPSCLLIDPESGTDLGHAYYREAMRERTGAPRFIARSISSGDLLDEEEFAYKGVEMPPMEGSLRQYSQFMASTEYQELNNPNLATYSDVKFAHQLFHDSESTFWVIAWTLARSTAEGSKPETNPHLHFCKFFYNMYRHYPIPEYLYSRSMLCLLSEKYWKSILHPDLAILAPMLKEMSKYIRPEWAHRPDLNPEHAHEALMRLLLGEIVHIDETEDIPLAIGTRPIPPLPEYMY
ncbi:hypothetical protein FRC11_010531 [Ceratobasidium sp. 423]|nr:hypothetical protein FRC11_010531 [Ceratobasidium sp. 423]